MRLFAVGLLVPGVLLSACVVGPDYVEPEVELPDLWHHEIASDVEGGDAPLHNWWTVFDDETLNGLIDRVDDGNLDLKLAFGRVMEARALLGIARGQRFPEVAGTGGLRSTQISQDLLPTGIGQQSITSVGVDAAWEIDLWGRVSRSVESASAGYQASVENYRDVLVILYADVAFNYLELRATQARIRYVESNVELQRGTLQLTRDRFEAEVSSELDVRQAELNLERTASFLPSLRIAEQETMHRLAVLLGEHPGALHAELAVRAEIPPPPERIGIVVPTDILRQRPDIRRAEREVAAQTARIGVATAELYPQFQLAGSFGFDATGALFSSSSKTWTVGPSFRWNLFQGGRIRANIEAEKERAEQAVAAYEQTVLLALEEVENALVNFNQQIIRRDTLQRSVTAAQQSVDLVETLYRTGITDFLNVLQTQRALVQQQDQLANSEGRVVQSLVALYKALGGGWQPSPEELEAMRAAQEAQAGQADEARASEDGE